MRDPAQAAAAFHAALHPGDAATAPTPEQGVRLGLCLGLAHFSLNQITQTLQATRPALHVAATLDWPPEAPRQLAPFDPVQALQLLEHALAALCAAGLHAFVTGGALLGLVREGRLLAHDKDLDVVVPIDEFARAQRLLPTLGWQQAWIPVTARNFCAFVYQATGITLDLIGYAFDAQRRKYIGGWWPPGRPPHEGRLLEFSPFNLVQRSSPAGQIWAVDQPEQLLNELYGPGWRQPDPNFEPLIGAPALATFNDYTRALSYLRLLEAWTGGRRERARRLLDALHACDPDDPILSVWLPDGAPHPEADLIGGTFGCFDVLHVGHLRFLQAARAACTRLKVGVCTDACAWNSKQCRPVIPQEQRLEMIRGLACVDEACLFDGSLADTAPAVAWIRAWGVNRLFASQDWANSPRWQALEPALRAHGIGCVWLPYTAGISSTIIRTRIKDRP